MQASRDQTGDLNLLALPQCCDWRDASNRFPNEARRALPTHVTMNPSAHDCSSYKATILLSERYPAAGVEVEQVMRPQTSFRLACSSLAAVLLFCGLALAQPTDTNPVQAITSALRAGEFDRALQIIEPELRQNPKNAQLWALDGIALSGKGQKKPALMAFKRALAVSADYLPALEGAAQIEYDTGDRETASLLQHVLRLSPGDATAHAMLAVLDYKRGDCPGAISHFERSAGQLESNSDALREYGLCLGQVKNYDAAITVFQKLATMPGDDPHDVLRLASIQLAADKPADAIQSLQPILEAKPDTATLALAAEAYESQKDTPRAVELLHQAIVEDPQNVDLYVQFADIALVHQSFQVGIDMVDAGLKLQPQAAALYLARGVLYVQLADYDHAETDFEKADKLNPHLGASGVARGMLEEQKDDLDKALALVRAKLKQQPNDPQLLYVLADTIVQKNPDANSPEFDEAVAAVRKAVRLQPNLVNARDTLAKLYLQEGKIEPAIEESRASLHYDAADQVALYHLIVGLRKTGNTSALPELSKRLAELRLKATREEQEHNRYKLVEQSEQADTQKR